MREATAKIALGIFPASEAAYTLPSDVLRARQAAHAIEGWLAATRDDPQAQNRERAAAVRSILEAAIAGKEPGPVEKALRTAADQAAFRAERAGLLADALELADLRLVSTIVDHADEILAEHLRPALETALAEVRGVLEVSDEIPWTDARALARASDAVRLAYETVRAAVDRLTALRAAQGLLQRLTGEPAAEAFRVFGSIKNLHDLWPQHGQGYPVVSAPWPTEPGQALVWQLRHGADIWMPTAIEVVERYMEWRTNHLTALADVSAAQSLQTIGRAP